MARGSVRSWPHLLRNPWRISRGEVVELFALEDGHLLNSLAQESYGPFSAIKILTGFRPGGHHVAGCVQNILYLRVPFGGVEFVLLLIVLEAARDREMPDLGLVIVESGHRSGDRCAVPAEHRCGAELQ